MNGVAIYGGFDPGAGAFRFKDRDWMTYVTILSGDIGIAGDSSDNVYRDFYHPAGTDWTAAPPLTASPSEMATRTAVLGPTGMAAGCTTTPPRRC